MTATTQGGHVEISPPKFSPSGRWRSRAAGRATHRAGANLSDAAGTLNRRLSTWRFRHRSATDGSLAVGASWQQIIVENRPGASSNVATEMVARALPDGYTLLYFGTPAAINATLYDKLNLNFIRDIQPVGRVERQYSRHKGPGPNMTRIDGSGRRNERA